jgi:hypothetical protein
MPLHDPNELPDSALGLFNIHAATGLNSPATKRLLWDGTRQAIEAKGFKLGRVPIGEGATSVVFDARLRVGKDLAGCRYVVKAIDDPGNKRHCDCFHNEVKLLASEHAPKGVVPLYVTHGDVDNPTNPKVQPFLVLEKIDGWPIHEYVKLEGGLPLEKRLELLNASSMRVTSFTWATSSTAILPVGTSGSKREGGSGSSTSGLVDLSATQGVGRSASSAAELQALSQKRC